MVGRSHLAQGPLGTIRPPSWWCGYEPRLAVVSRGRHMMVARIFPLPPGAGSESARWVGEEVAPGCSRGRPGVEHFVEALASARW